MNSKITEIRLNKLYPHPDNPNKISKSKFTKLVRSIEECGFYKPLIVRRLPGNRGYQIIDGCKRLEALKKLGYKSAECIIRNLDDSHAKLLLFILNRLSGRDRLARKKKLVWDLAEKFGRQRIGKLVPYNKKQLDRLLTDADLPETKPKDIAGNEHPQPVVFFLDKSQRQKLNNALLSISKSEKPPSGKQKAKALVKLLEILNSGSKPE
jgi:ParB/RepB/Spo0J family partition protein